MIELQNGILKLEEKDVETLYYALDRLYEVNLLSSEEFKIYKIIENMYNLKSKY